MAFIRTIHPDDARDDVLAMYERQQSNWGYVPNYAKVFSHRPEVMARWASLQASIKRNIGHRRFELVTFAAARALGNSYCSLAHYASLTKLLSDAETDWLVHERGPSPFSAAETALVEFSRKAARQPGAVTAGDVEALARHGFTDTDVFDVVTTVAGRLFFAGILDGLGVEADQTYVDVDEPLRRALMHRGRPIDFRPVERLVTTRDTDGST